MILLKVVLVSHKVTYAEHTDFGVILDADLYLNLLLLFNRHGNGQIVCLL